MNTSGMDMFRRHRGFSLIEFMIAITVSLVILAALSGMFVANSRARLELERANQQIENGRYAMMALTDDLQIAGFLSHYNLTEAILAGQVAIPAAKPAPCVTTPAALTAALGLHVQGYDNASVACNDSGGANLLADHKAGTDVLVIRRVSPCVRGAANCPALAGAPYFQASLCEAELNIAGGTGRFRLDTNIANLNRKQRNCTALAPMRQFMVHVYFVANNDQPDDGIPTLMRAELTAEGGAAQYKAYPIANGIEDLQIEYGVDTDADGRPNIFTPNPDLIDQTSASAPTLDTTLTCATNAFCGRNWQDVVSAKVNLLARNPSETRDHVDTKTYMLGVNVDGDPQCARDSDNDGGCEAFGDGFKRHVYQSAIRLMNAAGRRE